jgi:pimeloyl-ACP methyl ester carboxylesterase
MAEAFVDLDDVTLCYETFGDPANPTVFLIMGLGCQMIDWPEGFCALLVDQGFHVVRYDNRDAGRSTHMPDPVDVFGVLQAVGGGEPPDVPYLLSDLARDAVGLLDHLRVGQAHVVGVSLGGMIAQTLALDHSDRIVSLTSIMSTPGPAVAPPAAEALNALLSPPPQTVEEAQEGALAKAAVWGSHGLYDEEEIRGRVREAWGRHYDPMGTARQFAAVVASGDRTERLHSLDLPTLVVHGTADTLIPQHGGEATAAAIPDAKLLIIEGMGHDLPAPLWPQLVEAIAEHARQHHPDD